MKYSWLHVLGVGWNRSNKSLSQGDHPLTCGLSLPTYTNVRLTCVKASRNHSHESSLETQISVTSASAKDIWRTSKR